MAQSEREAGTWKQGDDGRWYLELPLSSPEVEVVSSLPPPVQVRRPAAEPQPRTLVPASPVRRAQALLLDVAILAMTSIIGWLIWSFLIRRRGQSPAKAIFGLVVVNQHTAMPLSWSQLLVRDLIVRPIVLLYLAALKLVKLVVWGVAKIRKSDAQRPVQLGPSSVVDAAGQTAWDRFATSRVLEAAARRSL